jgi:endo-1,3-1,4-beta-glycanase ExoK
MKNALVVQCIALVKNLKRIGLLVLSVVAAGVSTDQIAAQVPSGFGGSPIFDEEFNGSSLDAKAWTYRGAGTAKHDCYIDANAVSVVDGHARIRIYTANNSHGVRTNYCGAITTQSGTFLHAYGYWEARVRYQYQPGMHCGFWIDSPFIRSPIVNNPQQSGTEMDVFEHIESAGPTEYDHAVWWNGYGAYAIGSSHEGKQSNLTDGNFHTFGLAWTPGSLTFYVDGVQSWHLTPSDAAISNILEYIILDTELTSAEGVPPGGYGPLGSSSNPYMDVDYVRVYPYSTKTTSTTLSPIANVYVQNGASATKNFSGSATLIVENGMIGDKRNSYLKFDLSNITAPVQQATLYLTPVSVGESKTVEVANYVPDRKIVNVANYVPDNRWSTNGLTWNNQPSISSRLSVGINYGQGMLTSFDVTAMAKAGKEFSVQIAGDNPNEGAASIAYGSEDCEVVSYRPRLVVISGYPSAPQRPTAELSQWPSPAN